MATALQAPTRPAPAPSRGHRLSGAWSALTVLATVPAFVAYAVHTGLPVVHALSALAAVAVTQVLPGALAWRAVRPRDGWFVEDLAMGFALGFAMSIGAQTVAGLSRTPWLSAAIPLVVGAVLMLLPASRGRILSARSQPLPWWWGPVAGAFALPAIPQLVSYFRAHLLEWPKGAWAPHVDAYLHQALASELLTRGPAGWPTVLGEDLGYHWFTHAWIAHTAQVSGAGLDEVLFRVAPALMPALVVLATAAGALRLSGSPAAGVVAAGVLMLGSQANVFGKPTLALPITPLSPTAALAVPPLIALVVTLAIRWRGQALRGAFVLVPVLTVVASGTKGSASPLIVAGLGLAAAAMVLWNRPLFRAVAVDLVTVGLALILTMVVVFHGSSAGLALGATEAAKQTPVAAWLGALPSLELQRMSVIVTVLLVMTRAAPLFALPFSRTARRDPVTWLLIGGVLAGAGAVGVFSHPGRSQYYFAMTAIPLMSLGAALGVLVLVRRLGLSLVVRVGAVGALAGTALVMLPPRIAGELARGGTGQVWTLLAWAGLVMLCAVVAGALVAGRAADRLPAAGGVLTLALVAGGLVTSFTAIRGTELPIPEPVKITAGVATTQAQIDAARWIRDHSDVDDLVMTNRHCTTPRDPFDRCDSRRWLVTAFSERQLLVEGWTATPRATRIAPKGRESITVDYWRPDLLRLNDGFIARPTQEAADELRELGVRWIYVDHTRPFASTLEPYAKLRFATADAEVYEFTPR